MKKYVLYLLLIISYALSLNAKDSAEVIVNVVCSNSNKKEISIKISSNKLNLSEEAIVDNIGGYVDIYEDRYYIKTNNNVYYLNGMVEKNYINNVNEFSYIISNDSKKLINTKKLYELREKRNLKFIQKINLEKDNKTNSSSNITTTNIVNIYFNDNIVQKEYQKCGSTL